MKLFKFLVIFLLAILSDDIKAQSEAETIDWIRSVIQTYGTGQLTFDDGVMTYDDPYDPSQFHTIHQADLGNMGGLKMGGATQGYIGVYFTCKTGECVTVKIRLADNLNDTFDEFQNNKYLIQLNGIPTDLQGRLVKAFNHLIKLHGGSVIDGTF